MPYKDPEAERRYQQEYWLKHRDDSEFKAKRKKQWKAWYEKNKKKRKRYHREHTLGSGGNRIRGQKREYTGFCELCGKFVENNLNYHHWDDENLKLGIWVCGKHHRCCDGYDNLQYLERYLELKDKIIRKFNPQTNPKFVAPILEEVL